MRGARLKGFTATCGQSVFRGDRLPEEMLGEMFFGEPVGRLVRRTTIKTDEMGRRILHNPYQEKQREFIASTDANFRPVNSATGPDGTMYIVDMHRGIIQDGAWVPDGSFIYKAIRHYGLDKNIGRGRIYRVRHADFKPGPKPSMLNETPAQLVRHLSHPNGWWRDESQKLIVISQDKSVIPALKKVVAKGKSDLGRLHAFWTLEGLGALTIDYIATVFKDSSAQLRAAAVQNLEPFINDAKALALFQQAAKDSHVAVRKQILLSMSTHMVDETRAIADAVLAANPDNSYLKELDLELNRAYCEEKERLAKLVALNAQERELMEAGATHFKGRCATCHGITDEGVPAAGGQMMAPPFANNPRVLGDKRVLSHLALNGFTGPIDGKTYADVMMAPLKDNDDHYLASVLTYIRNSFGNKADMVTPAEVAEARKEAKGVNAPYTEATLRDLMLNTGGDKPPSPEA